MFVSKPEFRMLQTVLVALWGLSFTLGAYPASIPGDIDGSGKVDAVDIQLVINATLGNESEYDCDINEDGLTDAADVQLGINAAMGLYIPGKDTILLPDNVPLEMVWIPAGTFMMGRYAGEEDSSPTEDPQHPVTIASGFWMGKYELTKAQWTAVMSTTPWVGRSYVLDDPNSPAVYISWNDAQAFIAAINTLTGKTFRLPSEAEWEYSCRAGTTTKFYWSDALSYTEIHNYAWWKANAWDVDEGYAHVVGLKLPNAFGLYDMSGNVYEWCQDWSQDSYSGAPDDGSAWESPVGSRRVLRGGSWNYYVSFCRSACRHANPPDSRYGVLGFRVVLVP